MRFFSLLLLSLHLLVGYALCQTTDLPASADIYYWTFASSQPSPLARIEYNTKTFAANVVSYTPPTADSRSPHETEAQDLVRVGFYRRTPASTEQWIGSLISKSTLSEQRQKLYLHIGPSEDLYYVSFSTHPDQSTDALDVDISFSKSGTQPELNKPVVLSPDGTSPQVEEKTLFQKYWWVLLLVTFLAMSGGGGEGK